MLNSSFYESLIKGKIAKINFNDFIQSKTNPFPKKKVCDYMTLGPFVLETGGSFETEYLYQRHKILDHDYLQSSGGELNIAPYDNMRIKNDYWGEEYLSWTLDRFEGDVAFRHKGQSTNEAVFVTEQRNLVHYAAFYVECEAESRAIISYESSGSYLYLNGKLIDCRPYGRVKGLHTLGRQVPVTFNKGLNLVMFKVRVGYIADGLDHRLQECLIYPIIAENKNLCITEPFPSLAYFGDIENPRQVFPAFVGVFNDTKPSKITASVGSWSEEILLDSLKKGQAEIVRFSVPVKNEEEKIDLNIVLNESDERAEANISLLTSPYEGIDGEEYLFADFHFDTTYHQEQRVYALGAIHIVKTMLDELEQNPNFKAILSEVDYLHPFYSIYPEYRELLKEMFTKGRAEADCFYNQPNDLTSSGEGIVRNLVYGQIYHRDVLGRKCYVYSPGDVFGHHNQMSQICKKGGCTSANWGKHIVGLDQVFHHISPDGTSLMHHKGTSLSDAKRLGLKRYDRLKKLEGTPETYPTQTDTSWMKNTLNGAKYAHFSEMMEGFMQDEKENIEKTGETKIETTARDLTPHHAGVLLTRTDYKQANRLGENLLITAEKLASISAYYGADYPEKALDKAWRQLICAQHHDSITGTNNEVSFVDLMIEYREVVEIAADIINKAIAFLSSGVKLKSDELPIFVFNPHTWSRKDVTNVFLPLYAKEGYAIFDSKGDEYPFAIIREEKNRLKVSFIPSVPSFGYAVYYLKKTKNTNVLTKTYDNTIENEFFKLSVDPNLGGGIISIYDKINKKEVIDTKTDGPANQIVILKEIPDRCETQHEFYTNGMKMFSSEYKADVSCEKTSTYQRLTIYVRMDIMARIKQVITLHKGIQRIDMNTTVEDYQGRDDLFTLTFPVNVGGGYPVYEDRFAPHVCGKSINKLSFQTHQYYMYSHCQIAPTVNWFDLGPSIGLNLDDENSINIGMTAIIRAENQGLKAASDTLLKALAKKAIPVTPYDDVERHNGGKVIHFNEDFRNTDLRFVLSIDGINNEYENKIKAMIDKDFVKEFDKNLSNKGFSMLFMLDSDNYVKKPINTVLIKAKNQEILQNYINEIEKELSSGKAFSLKDAIVCNNVGHAENYGVSILNKGTIACSVEGDNLMNMMLFHTAEMYGNLGKVTGEDELMPEHKTHSFDYALYPHAGDFRDAKVFNKGMEFNDRLIAKVCEETKENAVLSEEHSFLNIDGDFILTSFKLGGYPLASMKADFGSFNERGFVCRGFEPNGKNGNIELNFDMPIKNACLVDLLEENPMEIKTKEKGFVYELPAHSIETFKIGLDMSQNIIGNAKIGIEKEDVEPTYIRTWEHDLGSMPIGYFSALASIGKDIEEIDEKTYKFKICVVNNHPDKDISGDLELNIPKGFEAEYESLTYDVKRGETQIIPLKITKPEKDSKGIIRLIFAHDGQVFEDVYEFSAFLPETSLRIEDDKIIASVYNDTEERLSGELSIATPFETWNLDGLNSTARGSVLPRTQKVDVCPGEHKEYAFELEFYEDDRLIDAFWAATKLMVNGRIFFGFDHKKGQRHHMFTHEFRHEIAADNNSLRKIFELMEP